MDTKFRNKRWGYEVEVGSKIIYVENLKHDEEDRFDSINAEHTLEEVEYALKMNSGRVLKVEITLAHNIYRDEQDKNQIITIQGEIK